MKVKEVEITKEVIKGVMAGDVSPVAMFFVMTLLIFLKFAHISTIDISV